MEVEADKAVWKGYLSLKLKQFVLIKNNNGLNNILDIKWNLMKIVLLYRIRNRDNERKINQLFHLHIPSCLFIYLFIYKVTFHCRSILKFILK